jgi:hypothetical protein
MSGYVLEMKCADTFLENDKVDVSGLDHVHNLLYCCLANRGRVIQQSGCGVCGRSLNRAEDDKVVPESWERLELLSLFFL